MNEKFVNFLGISRQIENEYKIMDLIILLGMMEIYVKELKKLINEMKVERGFIEGKHNVEEHIREFYRREVWNEIDNLIEEVRQLKAMSIEARAEIGEARKKLRRAYISLLIFMYFGSFFNMYVRILPFVMAKN